MADITLTTTTTLNSGTITVYVYEDVGNDGTGGHASSPITDADGNSIPFDNVNSTALTGGASESNTLSGFDASTGNAYFVRFVFGSLTNPTDTSPTVDSWELEVAPGPITVGTSPAIGAATAEAADVAGKQTTGVSIPSGAATAEGSLPYLPVTADTTQPVGAATAEPGLYPVEAEPAVGAAVAATATPIAGFSATDREEWRLKLQPSGTIVDDLFDVESVEALNRYASFFTGYVDDPDGTKFDDFPQGQRADLEYSLDNGTTWTHKQSGFVLRPEDAGADETGIVRVMFAGYDHLLRREPVYETFSAVTISSAVQTLIEDYTPVNYVAGNIDIVNDATVTREFNGERVDQVLSWLTSYSAGEEYGVNSDLEFFLRPREESSAPSNILDGQWIEYDLPEEGRNAINSIRIFYGTAATGNQGSVIVEDRSNQGELRDRIAGTRRVVFGEDKHYPEIGNRAAARAKGEETLANRSAIQRATIRTFERFGWEPGDIFRLVIPEKNVNDTYRAAEIRHTWTGDTIVKAAENVDIADLDDLLVGMSEDINRIDLRDTDPSADLTRYYDAELGAVVEVSVSVQQSVVDDGSFTAGFVGGDVAGLSRTEDGDPQAGFGVTGRTETEGSAVATTAALNQFRDAWQGDSANVEDITEWAVGIGTRAATQSDTELDSKSGANMSVTAVSASGTYAITFEGNLSAGGAQEGVDISEFGFYDASGDLHVRAVLDNPVTHLANTTETFQITFTIDTDPTAQGVITNTGQERMRDLYLDEAGTSGHEPTDRAYGSGTTDETESDSALATKLGEAAIASFDDQSVGKTGSEMELTTGQENGNTISEFGDENAANELLSRITLEGISKDASFNLVSDLVYRWRTTQA